MSITDIIDDFKKSTLGKCVRKAKDDFVYKRDLYHGEIFEKLYSNLLSPIVIPLMTVEMYRNTRKEEHKPWLACGVYDPETDNGTVSLEDMDEFKREEYQLAKDQYDSVLARLKKK